MCIKSRGDSWGDIFLRKKNSKILAGWQSSMETSLNRNKALEGVGRQ